MKPKISIVANFYNSRKYIPQLMESVFNQTYTNWELICIDDCSPQNDYRLLQKLTLQGGVNNKVTIIRNDTNLGISRAKKVGIDIAHGEYITFIDGDDWFAPQALEKLIIPAERHNLDCVILNNFRRYPFGYKKRCRNIVESYNSIVTQPEIIDKYYISFFGINKIGVAYWGKLFRTEIVRSSNFQYNNIPIGEDLLFNAYIFPALESMMFIDYYGYNWRFGGITSQKSDINSVRKTILDFIELYRIKLKLAQEINFEKAYRPMSIELKNILFANISSIAKFAGTDSKSLPAKQLVSEILDIDDYRENVSNILSDKNFASDSFVYAVSNRDVDSIYEMCHLRYRKAWKRRLIKNLLCKLT